MSELKKQFQFDLSVMKSYEDESGRYIVGKASGTEIDLAEEFVTANGILSMQKSIDEGGVILASSHNAEWTDKLGTAMKAEVTSTYDLIVTFKLDDKPLSNELYDRVNGGEQIGLSIGGWVKKAVWEFIEALGKRVKGLDEISLDHVAVTRRACNPSTWMSCMSKSVSWEDLPETIEEVEPLDKPENIEKTSLDSLLDAIKALTAEVAVLKEQVNKTKESAEEVVIKSTDSEEEADPVEKADEAEKEDEVAKDDNAKTDDTVEKTEEKPGEEVAKSDEGEPVKKDGPLSFSEAIAQREARYTFWDYWYLLEDVIWGIITSEEDIDKTTAVVTTMAEFQSALLGILPDLVSAYKSGDGQDLAKSRDTVLKAGKKMSAARCKQITDAVAILNSILEDTNDAKEEEDCADKADASPDVTKTEEKPEDKPEVEVEKTFTQAEVEAQIAKALEDKELEKPLARKGLVEEEEKVAKKDAPKDAKDAINDTLTKNLLAWHGVA